MPIDLRLFDGIDLNSLLTFILIYHEQSVSRAAEHLDVKQPAVSNTLAKLRKYFSDPLFVRCATGLVPTPRAEGIARQLTPAFVQIQSVLARCRHS